MSTNISTGQRPGQKGILQSEANTQDEQSGVLQMGNKYCECNLKLRSNPV
jgi:hypothetical protein